MGVVENYVKKMLKLTKKEGLLKGRMENSRRNSFNNIKIRRNAQC